jgi:hypothetical protein
MRSGSENSIDFPPIGLNWSRRAWIIDPRLRDGIDGWRDSLDRSPGASVLSR